MLWNISDASLGTEELGHLEMIGAIVYQLTRNLSVEQIKQSGFDTYEFGHRYGDKKAPVKVTDAKNAY